MVVGNRRSWFVTLSMLGLVLLLSMPAVGQDETSCTIEVQPGESIQEAIDNAPEGAVICLALGTYRETLRIDKSLTLQGMEKRAEITRVEEGPVILIQGSEDVEVIIKSLYVTRAKGNFSAVKVEGNVQVSLENCTISDNYTRALWVEGQAQVALENCALSDNRGDSITVWNSARIALNQCDISQNAGNGLVTWGSSFARLEGCTILENGDDGLWIMDSGHAVLENCTISKNDGDGVYAHQKAKLNIYNNRFLENMGFGVLVDSPDVMVDGEGNEMMGNGADLGGYTPATLRKPLVLETEQSHLSVPRDYSSLQEAVDAIAPGGKITVDQGMFAEGVTIWKPLTLQGAAKAKTVLTPRPDGRIIISVLAEARGICLRQLTVTGSEEVALTIFGKEVDVEGCQISQNAGTGIKILGSAWVNLESCYVLENGEFGLLVGGSARTTLTDCTLAGNAWHGLRAGGSANASLINCTIVKNLEGVTADTYAQLFLKDCILSANRQRGVVAGFEAHVTLDRCTVFHNKLSGLVAEDWGHLTLQDCTIFKNEEEGLVGERATRLSLDGCTVSQNGGSGLRGWDLAQLSLRACVISANGEDGIYLQDKAAAELRGCDIVRNRGYGIRVYRPECIRGYLEERSFAGGITGSDNLTPGSKEVNGNIAGALCPAYPGDPWPKGFLIEP